MSLLSIFGDFASIMSSLLDIYKQKEKANSCKKRTNAKIHHFRPEMAIVKYRNYLSRTKYGTKKPCDIELFLAHIQHVEIDGSKKNPIINAFYDTDHFNQDERCCVIICCSRSQM